VKFVRQFAAVVMVVAVVVLIGLAWSRLAPSLPGEGQAGHTFVVRGQVAGRLSPGPRLPPGAKPPGGRIGGTPRLFLGDLLEPVNLVVLRNNAFLEAAVIAAVVIVDASYRRLRRAKRLRNSQPR
jgi:hypothetical protein